MKKKIALIVFLSLLNAEIYAKSSSLDGALAFINILNGVVKFIKGLEELGQSSLENYDETKINFPASEEKRNNAYEIEKSGDIEKSIVQYKKSIELDPTNPNAWHGYGGALLKIANYKEAEQAFSEAIFLDDSRSSSWKYLGLTYERWGKLKSSAFCYTEAYKRKTSDQNIKTGVENIYIALRKEGIYPKLTNHGDIYFFRYNAHGALTANPADDNLSAEPELLITIRTEAPQSL